MCVCIRTGRRHAAQGASLTSMPRHEAGVPRDNGLRRAWCAQRCVAIAYCACASEGAGCQRARAPVPHIRKQVEAVPDKLGERDVTRRSTTPVACRQETSATSDARRGDCARAVRRAGRLPPSTTKVYALVACLLKVSCAEVLRRPGLGERSRGEATT